MLAVQILSVKYPELREKDNCIQGRNESGYFGERRKDGGRNKTIFIKRSDSGGRTMQKLDMLYEGKAKKVFKTDVADKYIIEYKDDATAFNAQKKELSIIKGW